MLADLEVVHVLAAALVAYSLYAAVVSTTTGLKARRLGRPSVDAAHEALCASRGWTYTVEDEDLPARFQAMPTSMDALTPEPRAVHVVTGTHAGLSFLSYEHRSWSRHSIEPHVYRHQTARLHVVAFDLDHLHPWLHLRPVPRPAGPLSRLRSRTAGPFERAYAVETTRRSFSTAVLHDEMRAHLLRTGARYQFDGTWLVMVVDGPARADQLDARLADLTTFLDLVPGHLLWRGRPNGRPSR
ncbi:hypothetical protein J2S40_002132 [Nocardioides luteus]|uniref:Uncharacterized protein n=1 Tax=Nocardioides luteus TaxID=1844 RepID=A0ABQ5SRF5_9ACTN|nr:hypothetical protein [Nocardioides luteus]MDR7311074.1 hypothetical protein [Nocardioides luteus]GGR68054.1 hypothetical protein GCM10010197_39390 [Nocardioides luteus]GLJ66620.1 hypothetical protein GCM10017579_06560 [Nocardioides luteus]